MLTKFSKNIISFSSQKYNRNDNRKDNKHSNRNRYQKRRLFNKSRNKSVKNEIILSAVLTGVALISYGAMYGDDFNAEEMSYFIGVDGGGTKTMLVLVDCNNEVIARTVSGSTNQNSVGVDATKRNLRDGIKELMEMAGVQKRQVKGVWLSMAGVDREDDKVAVNEWIKDLFLESTVLKITNDSYGALASGTQGQLDNSLVVISGTGSICVGFKDGQSIRTGGWGPMINDGSSGYYMGARLLHAIADHADGGRQTVLHELFMQRFGLSSSGDIITWTYKDGGREWSEIADLSKLVYQGVAAGDEVSIEILNDTAKNIQEMISLTINKMGTCDKVVLSGGNLTHDNSLLAARLSASLKETYPAISILQPTIDSAEGSALLASNHLKN